MFTWLFGSDAQPPILLKPRSSKTFITIVVALAVFTDNFAYGIVIPVFPFALASRAGIDPTQIQTWLSIFLAIYGATLFLCSPLFGWFADHAKSRQLPFIAGLAFLGGATVLLCVGNNIACFVVGRMLQGASAAVVWVVGLTLLIDTFGTEGVGTAMGYVSVSMSLAFLLASLLGGIVFAEAGYYQVYAMIFGLVVLDILLRVVMIEPHVARRWMTDDHSSREGSETARMKTTDGEKGDAEGEIANLESEMFFDDKQGHPTSCQTTNDAGQIANQTSSTSIPKKSGTRLPPFILLFGSRRILAALFACTMQSALLTAFDASLPIHVRDCFGWNSTGAGLIFIPLVLPIFISPLIGTLSDKYGPRWLATAGFVVSCPFLVLLRIVNHNSIGQKVLLCALLVLIGIGLTLASTPVMAEISYAVEAKTQGRPAGFYGPHGAYAQAYGLYIMAWALGATIGPLLAGLVMQASGWSTATLILGCVSIFTALPTMIWTGGSIFKRKVDEEF